MVVVYPEESTGLAGLTAVNLVYNAHPLCANDFS